MSTERAPDLKRCPFCGDAPRFIDDTGYGDCQIFCANEFNGCPAPDVQSSASEPEKAIAAWNRRPSPAPGLEEAVEAARRIREVDECFPMTWGELQADALIVARALLLTTRGEEREGVASPSASHRGCSVTEEDGNE